MQPDHERFPYNPQLLRTSRRRNPVSEVAPMEFGNKPSDGGHLMPSELEIENANLCTEEKKKFIRRIYGASEFINGKSRYCIWIEDDDLEEAEKIDFLKNRIEAVRKLRLSSPDKGAQALAKRAHQLKLMRRAENHLIVIPAITSEGRQYLPCGFLAKEDVITNKCFALYDAPTWNLSLLSSRLHLVWIGTVCVRLEMRFSYSNTLGWNTFPVPKLTDQNKSDLTRCAEDILLARESHFPATIADLYDPEKMPGNLRKAHERNDEVLERIYIGRRFKNDTERLEKLFELYTKMTAKGTARKAN